MKYERRVLLGLTLSVCLFLIILAFIAYDEAKGSPPNPAAWTALGTTFGAIVTMMQLFIAGERKDKNGGPSKPPE